MANYNNGLYFVTVCTKDMKQAFGNITDGCMVLSELGQALDYWINHAPTRYQDVCMVNYVIMPNHFHCLIDINTGLDKKSDNLGCLKNSEHKNVCADFHHNSQLATFIGNIKRAVTMYTRNNNIILDWQPRFHEHIVRHENAFKAIMQYIDTNVVNWHTDCFYKLS